MREPDSPQREQFYGRRRGRPLRAGQAQRRVALLPRLALALPETGTLDPASLFAVPPRSVGRVFILFPDPWPKARHHKRRLVAPAILDRLAAIMTDGAELRLATDDPSYLGWMLEHTTAHPAFAWTARRADDWRRRPDDWPPTRYETKARDAGRAPAFLRFVRRPRRRCPRPSFAASAC